MWPFSKPAPVPSPADITRDGLTARYNSKIQHWVFEYETIQFWLSGTPFNEQAFAWAREVTPVIKQLETAIRKKVRECIDGWDCDAEKMELLCATLDDYAASKTVHLEYTGDDSWGDLGVSVVIADGKITEVYGGD